MQLYSFNKMVVPEKRLKLSKPPHFDDWLITIYLTSAKTQRVGITVPRGLMKLVCSPTSVDLNVR